MSVIFLLIAASTIVAGIFLAAFIKAVRSGQFDDDRSPAVRMLNEDRPRPVTTPFIMEQRPQRTMSPNRSNSGSNQIAQ